MVRPKTLFPNTTLGQARLEHSLCIYFVDFSPLKNRTGGGIRSENHRESKTVRAAPAIPARSPDSPRKDHRAA